VIVYHGTNAVISVIDLSVCRVRTDFGKGFYFTDRIETAKGWALVAASPELEQTQVGQSTAHPSAFCPRFRVRSIIMVALLSTVA
jgi:hypothetical protein